MMIIGTVQNGKIVLPAGISLPEGTEVKVHILQRGTEQPAALENKEGQPTFHEGLMKFAGIVKDMPADSSVNHDHYLYGTPKLP